MADLHVAIVGGGLMGHGIAQVFAAAGHSVRVTDTNQAVLNAVPERIGAALAQAGVAPQPILNRIRLAASLDEAVKEADIVFEAAPEKLDLKREIFARVAALAPAHAILASNTSVIPITAIGEQLPPGARSRLLGTHWWNPPALVPLVEVIATATTSAQVFDTTFSLLESVGKKPIRVLRDIPGFIGNRLLHALWREAIAMVEAGVCDAETIDTVIKQSFGMRLSVLGPMENADLVGLELTRDIERLLFPHLDNSSQPSRLLDELIAQGKLGMRSGQGLRSWTPKQVQDVQSALARVLMNRK